MNNYFVTADNVLYKNGVKKKSLKKITNINSLSVCATSLKLTPYKDTYKFIINLHLKLYSHINNLTKQNNVQIMISLITHQQWALFKLMQSPIIDYANKTICINLKRPNFDYTYILNGFAVIKFIYNNNMSYNLYNMPL